MKIWLKRLFKINAFRLATLITFICIILYFLKPPFLELIELKVFDLRFVSRGDKKPGSEVVIATIDEKSLDELGRWPWPRTVIARLVDKLHSCQVKTIGFDIVFPEPDENSNLRSSLAAKDKVKEFDIKSPQLTRFLSGIEKEADTDRCREWDRGIAEFKKALDILSGDYPARMYLNRCIELKANPPDECWDCVCTLTTK